jgi:hypothetical protein
MVEFRLSCTDRMLWFEDQPAGEASARREEWAAGTLCRSHPWDVPGWREWSGSLRRKLLLATLVCAAAHLLLNAFVLEQALIPNTLLLCQGLFLMTAALIAEAFLLLRRPVTCCLRHQQGGSYLAWGMLLAASPVVWVLARLAQGM